MIKQKINIPLYSYTLYLYKLSFEDYKHKENMLTSKLKLRRWPINLDEETCNEIDENIKNGCYNGAITCREKSERKIVVFFYPIDNEESEAEIYTHEKRHVEDDILNHLGIDDAEASAYLAGFLGKIFYKFRKA